ncbi:ubiquitin-conjugating enzyme E2 S-like [Dysidea avara]|uniref:ubiquitin-conjugating enzyme E2 S-like n=1 Tax=Dysidea avara TaxID=196820 RepID=UPI00332F1E84
MMAASSSSNVENLSPIVIQKLTKELVQLQQEPPEGIKVYVNDEDVTNIEASIEGPAGTPYEGGMFRMKLVLPKDFPASPPQGYFLTKIFHPNVAKNGAICVNTLKKDWKPNHGIKHILMTVKCLLIYPNPESALNEEAGKLLLEHYDDYSRHARLITAIHAKCPRASTTTSDEMAHSQVECLSKKRSHEKVAVSAPTVDKKKKDKKKALRRL